MALIWLGLGAVVKSDTPHHRENLLIDAREERIEIVLLLRSHLGSMCSRYRFLPHYEPFITYGGFGRNPASTRTDVSVNVGSLFLWWGA